MASFDVKISDFWVFFGHFRPLNKKVYSLAQFIETFQVQFQIDVVGFV